MAQRAGTSMSPRWVGKYEVVVVAPEPRGTSTHIQRHLQIASSHSGNFQEILLLLTEISGSGWQNCLQQNGTCYGGKLHSRQ